MLAKPFSPSSCIDWYGVDTRVIVYTCHLFFVFFWFTFIPAPPIMDCYRARGKWWWVTHALCISISTPLWVVWMPRTRVCPAYTVAGTIYHGCSTSSRWTLQSDLTALERWFAGWTRSAYLLLLWFDFIFLFLFFSFTVIPGPPPFSLTMQLRIPFPCPVTYGTGQRLLKQSFPDSASRLCTAGSATRPSSLITKYDITKTETR